MPFSVTRAYNLIHRGTVHEVFCVSARTSLTVSFVSCSRNARACVPRLGLFGLARSLTTKNFARCFAVLLNFYWHNHLPLKYRSPSSNAGVIVYELNGPTRLCKGIVQQVSMAGGGKKYCCRGINNWATPINLVSGRPTITNYRQWEGSCLMSMAQRRFPIVL